MLKNFVTNLNIYTPTTKSNNNLPISNENGEVIYYKEIENNNDESNIYYEFPFVVKTDGTLWYEANMYLLWKIDNNPTIDPQTLKNHSFSLQDYINFCERENIDWSVAKKITSRPNWKYRKYLDERLLNGEISPNTLKKIISPNTSFYNYMIEVRGYSFDVKLFNLIKSTIYNKDKYGKSFLKDINCYDINQVNISVNHYDESIIDYGKKLKPLTYKEQSILFNTLSILNNYEMKLIFLFSVLTGARIETVLTLRLKHFVNSLPINYSENEILKWQNSQEKFDLISKYFLPVGPGTGVDTKKDKKYDLVLSKRLKELIITYIISKTAFNRRSKAKPQSSELEQYVFLSNRSNPYFMSSTDTHRKENKNKPKGGAINTFICDTLKPKLKELNKSFPFHFHNLRATFAMNYLIINQPLVDKGIMTQLQLTLNLQKLMGHEKITSTMRYIEYYNLTKDINQAQDFHEEKLLSWL
ncbi:site-specific integrase [Aliarcobacter butzleri]|uniref:Site-specific integrase n=1 Tax=Aliarcobacter butzleri TaxID=28197 RepID=A0AAW7PRH3_9BACT|nr:site-specific integrase [Aliarcobacter butzleri]MDN5063979.1 site-specific integrase [Aliarcobacter butzleri]MDN5065213.1 site-specific integrase [Aliarcobacter butzleri]